MTARSSSAPSRSRGTSAAASDPSGTDTATVSSSIGSTNAGRTSRSPMLRATIAAYTAAINQPSRRTAAYRPTTSAVGRAPLTARRRSTRREETVVNRLSVAAAHPRPIASRRSAVQ